MSIFALFALDTLNTLLTLCTISSVSNSKGCSITISKGNRVNINKTYSACFGYRRNTVTSFTLNAFGRFTTICAVDVPSAVLNGNDGSVSVFAFFTLDTLNTLLALCTCRTVCYSKGGFITVRKRNCVSVNKSFGLCFFNRGDTITGIALNTFTSNLVCIYPVNVPISILNGDNRAVSISSFFTLDTLNTLYTVSHNKGCCSTISKGNSVSISQSICICFDDRLNTRTGFALSTLLTLWSGGTSRTLFAVFTARRKHSKHQYHS